MRFLVKTVLLLALLAFLAAWGLRQLDQGVVESASQWRPPDIHLPRIERPQWTYWYFWSRWLPELDKEPATTGEAWISRPGDEPVSQEPYVPDASKPRSFPPGTVFRWEDQNGVMNYTQEPQPGVMNTPVMTDRERNVVPSVAE